MASSIQESTPSPDTDPGARGSSRPAGPVDPRLLKRASATRTYLIAGVVVGLVTAVLLIAQAWLISHSVVRVFEHRTLRGIGWMALCLLAVFAARGLLAWLNSLLAHRAAAAVKSQLRRDVMAARLAHPTASDISTPALITLVTEGLDALDGYFSKYLPQLALAVGVPFLIGGTILLVDWQSALIVAFTLPLIPVFMALIGWTTQKATEKRFVVLTKLANHFADLVEGLPTLQAFGRARAQRKGVELNEEANRNQTMRVLYVSFLSSFALELLATLSVAVVAVTIGFRLVFGHVDFTTALFVLILAPEAFLPVRQVGVHFHDSADGVAAADAAFAVIDAGSSAGGSAAVDFTQGGLQLDSVGFSHGSRQILDDLNLRIAPGEIVALAGPSGSGKTTVLNLVMGFTQPNFGRILAGGVPLSEADLAAWREQIAYVAQNAGLINGTVADNVRLGFAAASDEDVAHALRDAAVEFSAETPIGDQGEGLSAGERRRVAMARALVRIRCGGAKLLVLDEPTAGLDAESEARVIDAVRETGAAGLIVSHRPAVMAMADRVVELRAL